MCVRLADQSTQRVEGILDEICMTIDGSYIIGDFVVLDTSHNPKAPIILGRPFLHTVKATIYVAATNMRFNINRRKRRFSFNPPNLGRHLTRANHTKLDDVDSIEIVNTKFYKEPVIRGWKDISWPIKKGNPGHPIIIVSIGSNTLELFVILAQPSTLSLCLSMITCCSLRHY